VDCAARNSTSVMLALMVVHIIQVVYFAVK